MVIIILASEIKGAIQMKKIGGHLVKEHILFSLRHLVTWNCTLEDILIKEYPMKACWLWPHLSRAPKSDSEQVVRPYLAQKKCFIIDCFDFTFTVFFLFPLTELQGKDMYG